MGSVCGALTGSTLALGIKYGRNIDALEGSVEEAIEKGIEIIKSLRGYTTGFAVPVYLLDTPYGKIPMNPETIVRRDTDTVFLRSWDGEIWREPNKHEG